MNLSESVSSTSSTSYMSITTRPAVQFIQDNSRDRVGPYSIGQIIGRGGLSEVRLAEHVISKELAAMKFIPKEMLVEDAVRRKVHREIAIMKLMDHPNILHCYDVYENDKYLMLVLEYAERGELFDYILEQGYLQEDVASRFFVQFMDAINYMQTRFISHRDLKPENLLLDHNMNVKVADFGMAVLNFPGIQLRSACGSPHYAAPEVVSGKKYNGLIADIWSCGVILYVLVTGGLPFDDDEQDPDFSAAADENQTMQRLLQKVAKGEFEMPAELSSTIQDLLSRMLEVDSERRIKLEEILKHPWLTIVIDRLTKDDYFNSYTCEPVATALPELVNHLVDLGFGTPEQIPLILAAGESTTCRRFYYQLLRHNVFRRAKRAGLTKSKIEEAMAEGGTHCRLNLLLDNSKLASVPMNSDNRPLTPTKLRKSAYIVSEDDLTPRTKQIERMMNDLNGRR